VVETLSLWRRLVAAQVRSQLQYRTSFVLESIGSFLTGFLDFLAVLVIFHNTSRLGSWSVGEVAFLFAFSSIAFAFADLLIGSPFDIFGRTIRTGSFDVLLVRPRSTLFQVAVSDFQLRRLGKAVQGVVVLVYALSIVHVHWTVARAAVLLASVPAAVVIFGAIWVVFGSTTFWTVEGQELTNAFTYGGGFMTQYPIDIYGVWLRRLLAYLVPTAFVCYFPALYVLGKPDPLGLPRILQFLSPVVAVAAAAVAAGVWRFAVRYYRSAGG
jgi:ABC-2 type transport system permease protein